MFIQWNIIKCSARQGQERQEFIMVKKIANNDMTEVLAEKVALVDFSATWCGPCQMLAPVVDALAEELEGQVAVYNVDVDANSDLAMQYRVMSVPSLLLFKDGQVAGQTVGYQSADEIKAFIANN